MPATLPLNEVTVAEKLQAMEARWEDLVAGYHFYEGLDCHSRCCVGWAMDDSLATRLPLAALDMALNPSNFQRTLCDAGGGFMPRRGEFAL